MTTITVPDKLAKKLNKAKYNLNLPTISDVIERLFNIVQKINSKENIKNATNDDTTNGSTI